jgi:hypothetical protein
MAFVGGLSVLEFASGLALVLIAAIGIFFWGSGLGWRDPKRDRRNGL